MLPKSKLARYSEMFAALKLCTTNKEGRHPSTQRAIELREEYGVETVQGLVRATKGVLTRSTVNQYLTLWDLGCCARPATNRIGSNLARASRR